MRPALLAVCLLAPPAPSGDWPAWRGPTADGVAPADAAPPLTWAEGTNVKWKVPLTGRGSATPVVWRGGVYVVTSIDTGVPGPAPAFTRAGDAKTAAPNTVYRFEVARFDRATGREVWRHVAAEAVPHEGHHQTHSYAAGSPCTDGDRLYVSFGSFGVFAYDFDGHRLWKYDPGRLTTRLGWGEAVTPVAHGGRVVLNLDQERDSKLVALAAATGKIEWTAARDEKTSWNTPLVVEHAGRTQVIVNGTTKARGYDLATGRVLWQVGGMTTNAIPSPVAAGGVAYLMSGYRGSAAVAVPLDATGDVTAAPKWKYAKGTPYVPSPVLVGGRLYFTQANTATLTVLDAATGRPLVAGDRLPQIGSLYGSPVAAAGRVYFVGRDGVTVVIKQGDAAEVLAVNTLADRFDSSPAVAGKELILRGEKFLYCLAGE